MERLRQRLELAATALRQLRELSDRSVLDKVERDAAIQRFEYTFEATWKACQRYLLLREGIDAGSPKTVIRAARDASLLDDTQTESALRMTDDRNLTVHTYNEALAAAIAGRLPDHARLLSAWLDALERAVPAAND
jgi:nucleotidyltransferase substrate binding protein (TIGR01987 family)